MAKRIIDLTEATVFDDTDLALIETDIVGGGLSQKAQLVNLRIYMQVFNNGLTVASGDAIIEDGDVAIEDGNVFIGTAIETWWASASILKMGGNSALYSSKALGASSFFALISNVYIPLSGTPEYISTDEASRYVQANGGHAFDIAPLGTVGNPITFTTSFQIFSSHDVATFGHLKLGILDTSPSDKALFFYTEGSSPVYPDTFNIIRQLGPNGGTFFSHRGTGAVTMQAIEAASLLFKTTSLERFRIFADGKLSTGAEAAPDVIPGGLTLNIGTPATDKERAFSIKRSDLNHGMTTFAETDTIFQIDTGTFGTFIPSLEGFSNANVGIRLEGTSSSQPSAGGTGAIALVGSVKLGTTKTAVSAGLNVFSVTNYITTVLYLRGNGDLYIDGTYLTFSDKRLKTDIEYLNYGLNEICSLVPYKYKRYSGSLKDGNLEIESNSDRSEIGFIAQEVYKLMPEIVTKPIDEGSSFWGIAETKLIPPIVKSIQQLRDLTKINDSHIQQIVKQLNDHGIIITFYD